MSKQIEIKISPEVAPVVAQIIEDATEAGSGYDDKVEAELLELSRLLFAGGEAVTFGDLSIGDMYNTKASRWVKMSETSAMCVLSSVQEAGREYPFDRVVRVIPLYRA